MTFIPLSVNPNKRLHVATFVTDEEQGWARHCSLDYLREHNAKAVLTRIAHDCTTEVRDEVYKGTRITTDVVVMSPKEYEEAVMAAYTAGRLERKL